MHFLRHARFDPFCVIYGTKFNFTLFRAFLFIYKKLFVTVRTFHDVKLTFKKHLI